MITGTTSIESINFYQIEPDSQFFTKIDQIIEYLKYPYEKENLIMALENTKKMGYKIKLKKSVIKAKKWKNA